MKTINGYPILKSRQLYAGDDGLHRQTDVILVDRGKKNYPRYVTAFHCSSDSQWSLGHYVDSLDDAIHDYKNR